jgi:hypothetical protein
MEQKNATSIQKYPEQLRHIGVWDEVNGQEIELITIHTKWAASNSAELYKSLWQVEYFSER